VGWIFFEKMKKAVSVLDLKILPSLISVSVFCLAAGQLSPADWLTMLAAIDHQLDFAALD